MAACSYNPFCLGMCEWTDCPGALSRPGGPGPSETMATPHPDDTPNPAPPASARAEPATTSDVQPERFASFVDDEKLALLSKGMTPVITEK